MRAHSCLDCLKVIARGVSIVQFGNRKGTLISQKFTRKRQILVETSVPQPVPFGRLCLRKLTAIKIGTGFYSNVSIITANPEVR